MKVRICYTLDVDDSYRRAINKFYGKPGLATRADVQDWIRSYGSSCDDDICPESDGEEPA